jgi:phage gpG-like protein
MKWKLMGISKDEVFKSLKIKLPSFLDDDEREDLMSELGEYLLSEVLDHVAQGVSPVTGKPFQKLSTKYADNEKGGTTLANLDLAGDMMSALEYQVEADGIKIGIFDEDQAVKAYGHITGFKGHPWLEGKAPKRKFIPSEKEYFASDIMAGVKELIDEYIDNIKDEQAEEIG